VSKLKCLRKGRHGVGSCASLTGGQERAVPTEHGIFQTERGIQQNTHGRPACKTPSPHTPRPTWRGAPFQCKMVVFYSVHTQNFQGSSMYGDPYLGEGVFCIDRVRHDGLPMLVHVKGDTSPAVHADNPNLPKKSK
jgi:hypothetical protein